MNDIVWTKSYEDYKTEVGQELSKASESFVRIGYLLKVARDTEVLNGTEFEGDYIKFAESEFGLEKTQVSRFIRINDKFSVGGNSETLKDEFKGYGTRKLGIMLTLPDEIVDELSPELTVEDIETIQEEIKEEQKITPLEQYAETLETEQYPEKNQAAVLAEDDILGAALYQIMEEKPELYVDLDGCKTEDFLRIISPVPETIYITRVKGVGRLMLTFHTDSVTVVNARTNEKQKFSIEDAQDAFLYITEKGIGGTPKENWSHIYGRPYPENDKKEPEIEKNLQKTDEKGQKTSKKAKVVVTKEKKDAKKEQPTESKPEKHESVGEGAEAGSTEEGTGEAKEPAVAAEQRVDDHQPEGSDSEAAIHRETDFGGTEGEPPSSGTGEALSGEDSGAAGGEGNDSFAPGRNKYSGRIENLVWKSGMMVKELKGGSENYVEALKTAKDIRQCIDSVIMDLEKEEKPTWREIN